MSLDFVDLEVADGSVGVAVGVAVGIAVGRESVLALDVGLGVGTEVAGVDVRLLALARAVSLRDELLVDTEDLVQLLVGDVVEEDALAELAVGNSEALLAVSGLLDRLGGLGEELLGEQRVVHGQTDRRHEAEPLVPLGVVEHASGVGERNRVRHVNLSS